MPVTAPDVLALFPDYPADTDLSWAVTDAKLFIDGQFTGVSISTPKRDLLTKYIAGHLVVLAREKGGLASERMGDAAQSYRGANIASGLMSTRFGQLAIAVDDTGILATQDLGKRGQAEFRVV